MKLVQLSNLDKGNTVTSKKIYDDVMPGNYGIIINILIYSQFGAIRKLNSRWIVHNSSFFVNNNLSSKKR